MTDRTKIDRGSVRAEWQNRGFSCDLWVDAPGKVWTDFIHDVDERILVLDGAILIEMNGRLLRLEQGDETFIPAGTRHTVRNVGDRAARWLYGYRAQTA